MLGKKYSLGSTFENTGEARIKVANFDELKDQGSDIASFLNTFNPDPGFVYLHVIAMGAGEYYGCNVNGDYFPERDLINRHKTFETTAKVFKEHDNKPTSPDYGHVVFAWYNPKMHRVELILAIDKIKGAEFIRRQANGEQLEVSMGCFPAGTAVVTVNGTMPIESVSPGTLVLTHTGKFRKVKTVLVYPYFGKMYTITTSNGTEITSTANHPFMTSTNQDWTPACNLHEGMSLYRYLSGELLADKIQKVTYAEVYKYTVFNLSVEEDESYTVSDLGYIVHNCKVAYDVCSICGNKARKASDYCDHIRREKRKVYEDGKQAYMINYNPTFFDISIVRRRADKIAYVLSKVASESGQSISDYSANAFENLGSLIPFAPGPEEAVFDIFEDTELEKAASDVDNTVNTLEKYALEKRITSEAVKIMNDGIMRLMPALEAQEPDLPPALLDRIASKYSIPDILKSFILSAIPIKPREFTRIIIVQTGLPLKTYPEVLEGVLRASAIPPEEIKDHLIGTGRREILRLLEPFLMSRSSFLPAIMSRIDQLAQDPEKTAAAINLDVANSYYDMNPALNFGHVRRPLAYQDVQGSAVPGQMLVQQDPYATIPVSMTPEMYERIRRREPLKKPVLSPLATGLTLGTALTLLHGSDTIAKVVRNPAAAALLAATAVAVHNAAKTPTPAVMQKTARLGFTGGIVIPFVGAHLASAHYRNKYNMGHNLNSVQKFVAENPDVISLAAPVALYYGIKKHASIAENNFLEKISGEKTTVDIEGIEKLAELGDTLSDVSRNVFSGIILRGKRRSILSSVLDQTLDNHVFNRFVQNS